MKLKNSLPCPVCGELPEMSLPSGNLIGWEHKCTDDRVGFARHTFPDASMDRILRDWSLYIDLVKLGLKSDRS